jgi:hypothetical protein
MMWREMEFSVVLSGSPVFGNSGKDKVNDVTCNKE